MALGNRLHERKILSRIIFKKLQIDMTTRGCLMSMPFLMPLDTVARVPFLISSFKYPKLPYCIVRNEIFVKGAGPGAKMMI